MNRFYRPSAPRYTSQFVENQYPTDLILQAGAMKYQNKQKMASDIAEFSALANVLPAGNRTQEMAPIVRQNWDKRINDTITKFSSNYDSPQAMMEFTKLKQEWQRDPDVQLMKYDYEVGNKEWDEIRKSPTYAMDKKGDNINPATGMLKQFRPGDSYTPYAPVTRYAAWDEKAINELKTIEPQKRSGFKQYATTDPYGNPQTTEVQTDIEVRDPKMIMEKVQSMASNVINRSTPEGSYVYEDLKEKLGRVPKIEDAMNVYIPLAKSAMVSNETSRVNNDLLDLTKTNGSNNITKGKYSTLQGELADRPVNYNKASARLINGNFIDRLFNKPEQENNNTDLVAIKRRLTTINPKFNSLDKSTQDKEIKKYLKDEQGKKYNLNAKYYGTDAEKEMNTILAGKVGEDGIIKEDTTSEFLRGATIIDYKTGKEVQDMDNKDALTKKGNAFRVLGRMTADSFGKQPMPGSVMFQTGSSSDPKQYLYISPDAYKEERPMWDFYGYQRASDSGVGDVFAIDFVGKEPIYSDVSQSGMNFDESKVTARTKNGLYFVPVEDTDGDIKVKIFAKNPSNSNIFDEKNPLYLKEYKVSDYIDNEKPMDALRIDIYKNANELLKLKNETLKNNFPNN